MKSLTVLSACCTYRLHVSTEPVSILKGQPECKFLKGRSKSRYHNCVGRGFSEKDLEIQSQSNLEINQKCHSAARNTPWICKTEKNLHDTKDESSASLHFLGKLKMDCFNPVWSRSER